MPSSRTSKDGCTCSSGTLAYHQNYEGVQRAIILIHQIGLILQANSILHRTKDHSNLAYVLVPCNPICFTVTCLFCNYHEWESTGLAKIPHPFNVNISEIIDQWMFEVPKDYN